MQDFESPRTLGQLGLLVVLIVVALVASDWLLGRVLPLITIEPPFILRLQNVPGVEKMWAFAEEGIQPIVFTGSSQLYTGISPALFNDRIKTLSGSALSSLSITIGGGVVTIQHDIIQNFIIPRHPQLIIYAIEMQALTPILQNGYPVEDFRNKPFGYAVSRTSTLERDVLLWLLEHSNWMRYRDNIREWMTGIRTINQFDYAPILTDDLGFFRLPQTEMIVNPNPIKNGYATYYDTPETRQLLAEIESACRQNNIPCLLLNMPLHASAYDIIPPETELEYQRVLHQTGLPVWDFNTPECRVLFGEDMFYNLNHMNELGAAVLSPMVAEVYTHVFYDMPIEGNATCAALSP